MTEPPNLRVLAFLRLDLLAGRYLPPLANHPAVTDLHVVRHEPVQEMSGATFHVPGFPPRPKLRLLAWYVWKAHQLLRSGRFDAMVSFTLVPYGMLAWLSSRFTGVPIHVHVPGGDINALTSRELQARTIAGMASGFDCVSVTGSSDRAWMLERGIPESRLRILSKGLDFDRFSPGNCARDIDVLFVGRLHPEKRPDRLAQILSQLKQTRPGLRAVVVGYGAEEGRLRQDLQSRGLTENVVMTGRTDPLPYLQRARVLLLPSEREGLPHSIIEAMGCGAVCVASDVGSNSDVVKEDQTGYLVTPEAIPDYVTRIETLLRDESLRQRLADEARKQVVAGHGYSAAQRCWTEIFQALNAGKRHQTQLQSDGPIAPIHDGSEPEKRT